MATPRGSASEMFIDVIFGGRWPIFCGYRTIQINYRQTLSLRGSNFQLQIQNCAAKGINFHYRNRSVGMSAENLSSQIQILSYIPIHVHPLQIQISGPKRINAVIISATMVIDVAADKGPGNLTPNETRLFCEKPGPLENKKTVPFPNL